MARAKLRLTETALKRSTWTPGLHADGDGLYLSCSATDTLTWRFIYIREGKRTELGLGTYPATTLSHAREQAAIAREQLARGLDPLAERRRENPPLVSELLEMYVKAKIEPVCSPTVTKRWRSMFKLHAGALNAIRIDLVTTAQIEQAMTPLWQSKPNTALYFRAMIERLINFAVTKEYRTAGPNPARWEGHLKERLTSQRIVTNHHAAMPYADLPAFMLKLRSRDTLPARCLEFVILTCVRQDEARGATWTEIDFDKALWSIPAERMKMRRPHTVPLTKHALAILRAQHDATGGEGFVFPSALSKRGTLSPMALGQTMKALKADAFTVHGMRSAYRDWMADCTEYPDVVAELNLAHVKGDATERAYRRTEMLERRGAALKDWSKFLLP